MDFGAITMTQPTITALLRRPVCATLSIAPFLLAASGSALAEFRPLDDSRLSDVTGQAGVTIEMAAKVEVGQLRWQDEGSVDVNGIRLSGQNNTMLDNMKLTLDVAGDGEVLNYGFSELAGQNISDPEAVNVLAGYAVNGSYGKQFNDGDLVMHLGAIDYGDPTNLTDFLHAVDFELAIDSIKNTGSQGSSTMFSDILLQGYLGPTDLVIRNDNSTRTLSNGDVVSGSELQLESHFEITNGHLNWDKADLILIFNLAAVSIDGLEIHNRRGNDTAGHLGMASVKASLSNGTGGISGTDGLSVHDVEFRADVDMPVFRVGSNSIGGVYFTDFAITDTNMMVYGH
ncbi:DUF6160 family protein [Marinobacter koreensis]